MAYLYSLSEIQKGGKWASEASQVLPMNAMRTSEHVLQNLGGSRAYLTRHIVEHNLIQKMYFRMCEEELAIVETKVAGCKDSGRGRYKRVGLQRYFMSRYTKVA